MADDAPATNDYVNTNDTTSSTIPVVKDTDTVESGVQGDGGEDSDEQLRLSLFPPYPTIPPVSQTHTSPFILA